MSLLNLNLKKEECQITHTYTIQISPCLNTYILIKYLELKVATYDIIVYSGTVTGKNVALQKQCT